MRYLFWQIRCAFHAWQHLQCSMRFAWELAGSVLANEREMQWNGPGTLQRPRDALMEQLSYRAD